MYYTFECMSFCPHVAVTIGLGGLDGYTGESTSKLETDLSLWRDTQTRLARKYHSMSHALHKLRFTGTGTNEGYWCD